MKTKKTTKKTTVHKSTDVLTIHRRSDGKKGYEYRIDVKADMTHDQHVDLSKYILMMVSEIQEEMCTHV